MTPRAPAPPPNATIAGAAAARAVPYAGRWAELYDAFYADKPYDAEAAWVLMQARTLRGAPPRRLLDVACGTGRHAAAFVNQGCDVVGVDVSPSMIDVARARLAPHGARARVVVGDMCALDGATAGEQRAPLSDAPVFDVVTSLFDSLGYAIDNDRVLAALRGMARAVCVGGVVVVEAWHAAAMLRSFEPRRERTIRGISGIAAGALTRVASTRLDVRRQTAIVRYTLHEGDAATGPVIAEETQENRFFGAQELAFFVESAGLAVRGVYGALANQPLSEDAFHVVIVAQRVNEGAS